MIILNIKFNVNIKAENLSIIKNILLTKRISTKLEKKENSLS